MFTAEVAEIAEDSVFYAFPSVEPVERPVAAEWVGHGPTYLPEWGWLKFAGEFNQCPTAHTSHNVIARSKTTKQSHWWDRPARNTGLPVIRHPGLRSGVQSRFLAYAGMTTGGTPIPPAIAAGLRPRNDSLQPSAWVNRIVRVLCATHAVHFAHRVLRALGN